MRKPRALTPGPTEFTTWRSMALHYKNRCEVLERDLELMKPKMNKIPTPIVEIRKEEIPTLPRGLM